MRCNAFAIAAIGHIGHAKSKVGIGGMLVADHKPDKLRER
jgi:hypothetical protein